jgi:hypothetical protein
MWENNAYVLNAETGAKLKFLPVVFNAYSLHLLTTFTSPRQE